MDYQNRTHLVEFAVDATPIVDKEPTDNDLIWDFIRKQIDIWGDESIQKMFDDGFEPKVFNGKVIWIK